MNDKLNIPIKLSSKFKVDIQINELDKSCKLGDIKEINEKKSYNCRCRQHIN